MKLILFLRNLNEKKLINLDKIPGILHNKEKKNILIKINNNKYYYEILKINSILKGKLLNNNYNILIKNINYHYYKKIIFHVDFLLI